MKKSMSLILMTIMVCGVILTGSAAADDAIVEEAVFYVQ